LRRHTGCRTLAYIGNRKLAMLVLNVWGLNCGVGSIRLSVVSGGEWGGAVYTRHRIAEITFV
jgi:hypothetical protein